MYPTNELSIEVPQNEELNLDVLFNPELLPAKQIEEPFPIPFDSSFADEIDFSALLNEFQWQQDSSLPLVPMDDLQTQAQLIDPSLLQPASPSLAVPQKR